MAFLEQMLILLVALAATTVSGRESMSCSGVNNRIRDILPHSRMHFLNVATSGFYLDHCSVNNSLTCCTRSMEGALHGLAGREFERHLQDTLLKLLNAFQAISTQFDALLTTMVRESQSMLDQMFQSIYGMIYEQNAALFVDMYEDLQTYYKHANVNLDQRLQVFYRALYKRIFSLLNKQYTFSDRYWECMEGQFDRLKPFGNVPQAMKAQVRRAFVAARVLVTSLKRGRQAVDLMIKIFMQCGRPTGGGFGKRRKRYTFSAKPPQRRVNYGHGTEPNLNSTLVRLANGARLVLQNKLQFWSLLPSTMCQYSLLFKMAQARDDTCWDGFKLRPNAPASHAFAPPVLYTGTRDDALLSNVTRLLTDTTKLLNDAKSGKNYVLVPDPGSGSGDGFPDVGIAPSPPRIRPKPKPRPEPQIPIETDDEDLTHVPEGSGAPALPMAPGGDDEMGVPPLPLGPVRIVPAATPPTTPVTQSVPTTPPQPPTPMVTPSTHPPPGVVISRIENSTVSDIPNDSSAASTLLPRTFSWNSPSTFLSFVAAAFLAAYL